MDQIRISECCKCNHITGRMTSSEFSFQILPSKFINCCFRYSPVHLIFNFIHLFLALLGLVFVAVRIFLQLQQTGATLLQCSDFSLRWSCCRAHALGCVGFRSRSTLAQQLLLVGSRWWAQYLLFLGLAAQWHVQSSWTRNQPVTPALAGRFLSIVLPGSLMGLRKVQCIFC